MKKNDENVFFKSNEELKFSWESICVYNSVAIGLRGTQSYESQRAMNHAP